MNFRLLLQGYDTIECAYFLIPGQHCLIDFEALSLEREILRQQKSRDPKVIELGGVEYLLQPYGSNSGYPFRTLQSGLHYLFG